MLRRIIAVFAMLVMTMKAEGQFVPMYRHYTMSDGLPSNTIYDMTEDRRGFMWFCTDRGVSRFDGREFKNFSTRDGIPDNEVLGIKEDPYGRLWLMCYNRQPAFIEGGIVYNSSNSVLCKKIDVNGINYVTGYVDKNGRFCLGGNRIFCIEKESLLEINKSLNIADNSLSHIEINGQDYILYYHGILRLNNMQIDTVYNVKKGWYYGGIYDKRNSNILLIKNDENDYSLEFYSLESGGIIARLNCASPIYSVAIVGEDTIELLTKKGIKKVIYKKRKGFMIEDENKYSMSFNRKLNDRQGRIWFASLKEGEILESSNGLCILKNSISRTPLKLDIENENTLIITYSHNTVGKLRNNKLKNIKIGDNIYGDIKHVSHLNDHKNIVSTTNGTYLWSMRTGALNAISKTTSKCMALVQNKILIGSTDQAYKININTGNIQYIYNATTISIDQSTSGIIYLGTNRGIYYGQVNAIKKLITHSILDESRVISIKVISNNQIAMATEHNGIYIVDTNGNTIRYVTMNDGDICTGLKFRNDKLWIVSENGVKYVACDGNSWPEYNFINNGDINGSGINDIEFLDGRMFIASSKGLLATSSNNIHYLDTPEIYLTSLTINGRLISSESPLVYVDHKNNYLTFEYTGLSSSTSTKNDFRYLVVGLCLDTMYTSSQRITFSSLSHGKYTLYVWAKYENANTWSKRPAKLTIIVGNPFWYTPIFIGLSIATISSIIYFIFYLSKRLYRRFLIRREQQRLRNLELKMQALKAQINPHFLFNALNCIQSYYLTNNDLKANEYMTMFSSFMRKVLYHSDNDWVPLKQEMDIVSEYFTLESMRFEVPIKLHIYCTKNIDISIHKIPAMLIQPYLENSLLHAFPREFLNTQNTIFITFSIIGDRLVCEIEDNGVGIANSTLKRPQHKGYGIRINFERINILSRLYGNDIGIEIVDNSSLDSKSHGTKITVTLPILTENDQNIYN